MRSRKQVLGVILASACYCCCSVSAASLTEHQIRARTRAVQRRGIVSESEVQDEYDFIIVGGGVAGLTIASRLSEDSNYTVLVLEAGDTGEAVQSRIDIPGDTYYDGLMDTEYNWAYTTTPQSEVADRTLTWPRGRVLGGSSAVNGLYAVRPNKLEHDTWAELQESADGADAWNWDHQVAYYDKSETFTAPDSELASAFSLNFNPSSHGENGPVHVSWPAFQVPIVSNWSSTLTNVGISINEDAYGGSNTGGFVALSTINPSNYTRSYALNAYINPLPPRDNLAILPNALVTRIEWSTDSSEPTATGVTYQLASTSSTRTIRVSREVILAGGAIGSPHVLLLSGVGPSDVLSGAGVDVVHDLPGVGQHLQDHIVTGVSFSTTAETYASIRDSGNTDPIFLSYVNGAIAYVNITTLFGEEQANTLVEQYAGQIDANVDTHIASQDDTVREGYKAIQHAVLDTLLPSGLGQVEILFSVNGQPGAESQSVTIQAALQHPLSQGRLFLSTSDPTVHPSIDPWYLSHEFDLITLREGLKLARTIGNTEPLSQYFTGEVFPGTDVTSDADWETFIRQNINTEYHPANTCAMLPLSKGGVVDPKLRVYGLSNVRVADASVIPIQFASHLMMSVYALGETAADIIKAEYNNVPAPGEDSNPSGSNTGSSGSNNDGDDEDSGALMGVKPLSARTLAITMLLSVLGAVFAA